MEKERCFLLAVDKTLLYMTAKHQWQILILVCHLKKLWKKTALEEYERLK